MNIVAQDSAARPSTITPASPTAMPIMGTSPLDDEDVVNGILLEADATLSLALDALEEGDAGGSGSALAPVFTVLLALQRRLEVAREVHHNERRRFGVRVHHRRRLPKPRPAASAPRLVWPYASDDAPAAE